MTLLATAWEDHEGRGLRVARLGAGPPLVLLHGYPDNLQVWSALAPRLAARHEVIAFDWPGMGWSQEWPGGATPQHQAERLRTLLDRWRIDRVSVVGMDMGAPPALVLAARHPDRVTAVVAMNALLLGDQPTSWEIRVLRHYGWNERLLRALPGVVFRRALRTFLPAGVRVPEDLRRDLWESFRKPGVRRFVSRLCGGYEGSLPGLPAEYASLRRPVLALWGERDRHFPPAQGRALCALVSSARFEEVSGGEHWMAWHGAKEVARHVEAFLRENAGPP